MSRFPAHYSHGRIQNLDRGPWTTPNFEREIVPVNIKIYRRSGYEKHRLIVFIAYVFGGISPNRVK